MKMNSGIGSSAKLCTESTALRTSCTTPLSPPMKTNAPTRLAAKKANTTSMPSSSARTSYQAMRSGPVARGGGGTRAGGAGDPAQVDRAEQQHHGRHDDEHVPLGEDEALVHHRLRFVRAPKDLAGVVEEQGANHRTKRIGQASDQLPPARRQTLDHELDRDVGFLSQHPRRAEEGDRIEHVLGQIGRAH